MCFSKRHEIKKTNPLFYQLFNINPCSHCIHLAETGLSALSCCFRLITQEWGIISQIFGSEVVKKEGACLSVSQVSGATHSTATDTPGVCEGEDREERRGRGEETIKIRQKRRGEGDRRTGKKCGDTRGGGEGNYPEEHTQQ